MELSNQTKNFYLFKLKGQTLYLLSEKAVFWKEKRTIILSDLHLGKAAHFRKSGIQIPESVHMSDYQRLNRLVNNFKPERILLLGDLFHSDFNEEWGKFRKWIIGLPDIRIILIMGNHDILPKELYKIPNLTLKEGNYEDDPFSFVHNFVESENRNYVISGHIHPGVRITGPAKQYTTLPCFYFSDNYAVLPAFGKFTGIKKIKPREKDDIFVIFENNIHKM